METFLKEQYFDQLFYETNQYGKVWTLIEKVLHFLIKIFALFGLVRFKVNFIENDKLYKWISYIIIAYNGYIFLKFSLIAFVTYLFNLQVDSENSILYKFNCSLDYNLDSIPTEKSTYNQVNTSSVSGCFKGWLYFGDCISLLYPLALVRILNILGGPYKFLGNTTTLVYGFYAIAIYIMLILFPIEQILSTTTIDFNHIRYALNDKVYFEKYYQRKDKHLKKLSMISRIKNDSPMTLGTKKGIYLRDLRCRYVFDGKKLDLPNTISHPNNNNNYHKQTSTNEIRKFHDKVDDILTKTPRKASLLLLKSQRKLSKYYNNSIAPNPLSTKPIFIPTRGGDKLNEPIKSLKHSIATNIHIQPSYNVRIANENLTKFRPYVRSSTWHKCTIIIYTYSIIYTLISLLIIMVSINYYMHSRYKQMNNNCFVSRNLTINKTNNYLTFSNWTIWDNLTYFETQYAIVIISISASFYCSYYFGTLLDLLVWLSELLQQLHLCKLLLELTEDSARLVEIVNHKSPGEEPIIEAITRYHNIEKSADDLFNEFGGVKSLLAYYKYSQRSQSYRLKVRELMALKLLSKKQTVLRASHLNLNSFFDEFNETREIISLILTRTTQIAMGFSLLVASTKAQSQFQSDLISLTVLLCTCLAILNLYFIFAALINHVVSKHRRTQSVLT